MATLTLPAKTSPLRADRYGRTLLKKYFYGRRPSKQFEEAFAKAVTLQDKRNLVALARNESNQIKAERLKEKGLLGKWAENVLKEKGNAVDRRKLQVKA